MNRDSAELRTTSASEELVASEQQWLEVFEHNPAMYFMVDAAGIVLSVNAFGASQLGYEVGELVGQSVLNVIFEEDKEFVRKNLAVCLETLGRSNSWEIRQIRKDGTVLRVRENAKALRWASHAHEHSAGRRRLQAGQPIVLIVGVDITEQYRAVLDSARLAAIVSSSDDAIVSKSLDGKVTSWNTGATSIFGYEAGEMIGQSILRIIPPELQDEEMQILMRVQQGERIQHYETIRVAKDGRRIDISLTVSPIVDKSGKVVGASKVARDITSRKRAEAELRDAQTELLRITRVTIMGELTAAIAHEVNQPLTGLINSGNACLHWLAGETPNVEAARQSVRRMLEAGIRASEVVNRIRALLGKSPPEQVRLNINDTITETLALIHSEVQQNRISLQTKLSNDVPLVLGDQIQLQQVILNLVLNAIEAMSEASLPRELSIASAKDESNGALVTVRDSGVGLDATAPDRLFEAFYTTKAHGMGIGLSVSRKIIQSHGGQLWATPSVPQGAVFQFRLPAAAEEAS
jgi:PAS domain S-box-containing protein